MDWKTFFVSILLIVVLGIWGLMWICGKFGLLDKEDLKDGKKDKKKKPRDKVVSDKITNGTKPYQKSENRSNSSNKK